ncbi:MAG: hypothetical protein V1678_04085 [Candidatus Aenigmatarchaeota archaeon]
MGGKGGDEYEYNVLLGRQGREGVGKNDHELRRNSLWSMFVNTEATQTAIDPTTKQIYNVDFKFISPSENIGGYIIPGFYPQGDLLSVLTTIGSGALGIASGISDKTYANALVAAIDARHPVPSVDEILKIAKEIYGKPPCEKDDEKDEGKGCSGPYGYGGLNLQDQRNAYGDISINIENNHKIENCCSKEKSSKKTNNRKSNRTKPSTYKTSSTGFYNQETSSAILSNYEAHQDTSAILSNYSDPQEFFKKFAETKGKGKLFAVNGQALFLEGDAKYRHVKKGKSKL